jgi:hypothetical protein
MADSTTFHGGNAPFLGRETPRRRPGERSDIDTLRQRVRDLGVDLRRNWNDPPPEYFADGMRSSVQPSARRAPEPRGGLFAERAPREAPTQARGEEALAFAMNVAQSVFGVLSARRGLALKSFLGVLLAMGAAGLLRDWPVAVETPVAPVPAAAWVDISKPYPLFELFSPSLGQPVYTARRHAPGGGREDVLTFGQFGGLKPFLRLNVYRQGDEDVADAGYFVEMARRAAASGLGVLQAELPQALSTRFGDFESGVLELSGSENLRRGNCRGFRLALEKPALTMGGLMCGAGDEKLGAADLACVIDRFDLIAAGQDHELADFFGAAGVRKSRACTDTARRK